MNKVLLLFILITTTAFGQIDDCEKTLVFDKTYDFNEQKGRYFYKNPVKRIMGEHKFSIKSYLSRSDGTLIETFKITFGDDVYVNVYDALNFEMNWITTLDRNGQYVNHIGMDDSFGEINIDDRDEKEAILSWLLFINMDAYFSSDVHNPVKFYEDVERSFIEYYEEGRKKLLLTSKCEDPLEFYQCLFGQPKEVFEVIKCD